MRRECNCFEVFLGERDVCGIDVRKLSTFAVLAYACQLQHTKKFQIVILKFRFWG